MVNQEEHKWHLQKINGENGNKMIKYTKSCRNKVEIDIQSHLKLTQMLIVHNEKSKKSKNELTSYKENSILPCSSKAHFLFIFLKFCSPSSSWASTLNKAPNPEELRKSVQGRLTFSTSISSFKNDNRTLKNAQ